MWMQSTGLTMAGINRIGLSTPAVVGIVLGAALLLLSVAAVSCLCYRGRSNRSKKLRSPSGGYRTGFETKPLPFRKPTAVRSPNTGTYYLKKSPSPTGIKSPPGSSAVSAPAKTPSPLLGNTPSTLTPTCELARDVVSPQVSRKNSRSSGYSPVDEEFRESVIRFQVEDESKSTDPSSVSGPVSGSVKSDRDLTPLGSCIPQDIDKTDGEGSNKLGRLFFKVRHDSERSTLNITVVKCTGLPARDSNAGSSDPYVKLQLLPDKQHKVKTRVLRRTLNPVYDEDFTFYGIGENQLQSLTLHFVVLSFDRYSRDDVIGEVLLPVYEALEEFKEGAATSVESALSETSTISGNGPVDMLARDIAPRSHKMRSHGRGELLISLCYQPQASRLTAVVLKARNIPRMDMTGLADPYVKIYLVHNGQRIAKKKTHVKKRTLNPVFNESFVFDLPPNAEALDNISLEFLVLDWDRVTKNEVIGRLLLGGTKSLGTALHHWNEVLSSPRRQIAEWHKLKD
nr:EOG090X05OW [Sida crystallina]